MLKSVGEGTTPSKMSVFYYHCIDVVFLNGVQALRVLR